MNEFEVEFRTDHNITTKGVASMDDVRSLHNLTDDGYTGDGVTVVVMDSGIDATHPVFSGMEISHVDIVGGGANDQVGHGTACAGLIAQIAPDVELISLRIFGESGRTSGRVVMEAYQWLINNSDRYDIVNMSWGAQRKVQSLDNVHNRLEDQGVQSVVAAGNTSARGGSPATAKKAFSAGAVDVSGDMTRFSSYNPEYDNPDVVGIGRNNRLARGSGTDMGTVLDENWTKASGTSFSAPIVSGFGARVLEANPDADLTKVFESYARDIDGTPEDGAGIADYAASMSSIESEAPDEEPESEPDPTANADVWRFAGHDTVYLDADWFEDGEYKVTKTKDEDGSTVLRFDEKE